MKYYKCCTCGILKSATSDNFFPVQLSRHEKNKNATSLGKCSGCAKIYQLEYSRKLKEKKLSRKRNPKDIQKKGTIYVIGPKNNVDLPFKIGITSGQNVNLRLVALQTAHWLEMEIYYSSPPLNDVLKVEKFLHEKYVHKKIKGEWFNIKHSDILDIKFECEKIK